MYWRTGRVTPGTHIAVFSGEAHFVYTKQSLHPHNSEAACLHQTITASRQLWDCLSRPVIASKQLWGCWSTPNNHCSKTVLRLDVYTKQSLQPDSSELPVYTKQSLQPDSSEATCLHQTITASRQLWCCLPTPNNHCIQTAQWLHDLHQTITASRQLSGC